MAASANFPALLLALTWRRFNTTGAVVGVLTGVFSAIALVIISPEREYHELYVRSETELGAEKALAGH